MDVSQQVVDILSAMLVPTLAVAAIIYTRMQARTARDRLWLDVFDKRYAAYSATGLGRDASAQHEDAQFNALELSAAIIGCRMPEDDRAAFIELTKRLYPHASIRQTRMAGNKYQLEIEPL